MLRMQASGRSLQDKTAAILGTGINGRDEAAAYDNKADVNTAYCVRQHKNAACA